MLGASSCEAGSLRSAAAHLRALLTEGRVGDRLQRLVEAPDLLGEAQRRLAGVEAAVDAAHLLRQAVEPLEDRVELTVAEDLARVWHSR